MADYDTSFLSNAASIASQAAAVAVANLAHDTNPIENQHFPSFEQFDAIINGYLDNLSAKKRDKALVNGQRYSMILQVLKDPRNTSISTAQFRFWVKKMFRLARHDIIYHGNKPVATRENIYSILVKAHKDAHHGGRDKTSALVRKHYSWIPKELVARFVRHCPHCISKRNGGLDKAPLVYDNEPHSLNNNNTQLFFPLKQDDVFLGIFPQPYYLSDAYSSAHSCAEAAAAILAAVVAVKSTYSSDTSLCLPSTL
ncbi:hypothetical protein BY458DRAFT_552369 [Sporodiniella umbellata]|nr:hypothetical protein BY458DRAFT_552369 [Sporodiniella umbellata]